MIIYKTTNLINGKFYVGKTIKNTPKYLGSGVVIIRAVSKYGVENFQRETLQECNSIEELNEAEKYWIKETKAIELGYNISTGGDGGDTFSGKSDEDKEILRKKMSTIQKIRPPFTEEHKKLISEKISKSKLGKPRSKETIEKMSKSLKGIKRTDEFKEKLSVYNKGKILSKLHKEKISKSHVGITHTEETKQKMSITRSQKWEVIDPNGNILIVHGLARFCRENNLGKNLKRGQWFGWKAIKIKEKTNE